MMLRFVLMNLMNRDRRMDDLRLDCFFLDNRLNGLEMKAIRSPHT